MDYQDHELFEPCKRYREQGYSFREISKIMSISVGTVFKVVKAAGLDLNDPKEGFKASEVAGLSDSERDDYLELTKQEREKYFQSKHEGAVMPGAPKSVAGELAAAAPTPAVPSGKIPYCEPWQLDMYWLLHEPIVALLCAKAGIPLTQQITGSDEIYPSAKLMTLAQQMVATYETSWKEVLLDYLAANGNAYSGYGNSQQLQLAREAEVLAEQIAATIESFGKTPRERLPYLKRTYDFVKTLKRGGD